MKRFPSLVIASSVVLAAACDRQADSAEAPQRTQGSAQATPHAPAYDRTVDDERLVILCDPANIRLSIRHQAGAASLDASYPRRTVVDPETLVEYSTNHLGTHQYRRSLRRWVQCGPLAVQLDGQFLNADIQGEMGAMPPFAAVRVLAGNRILVPADAGRPIRLTPCDETMPPWEDCPADYAVRLDLAYNPEARRMATREWAMSGSVVEEAYETRERTGSIDIDLHLWRARER